jgi:uncharacterized membrane protein
MAMVNIVLLCFSVIITTINENRNQNIKTSKGLYPVKNRGMDRKINCITLNIWIILYIEMIFNTMGAPDRVTAIIKAIFYTARL